MFFKSLLQIEPIKEKENEKLRKAGLEKIDYDIAYQYLHHFLKNGGELKSVAEKIHLISNGNNYNST